MNRLRAIAVASVLSAAGFAVADTSRPPSPPDENALLRDLGFTARELRQVDQREVIARNLSADGSTVALAVAGIVSATPEFYLEKFRAIESFKKSPEVLQVGRLSRSPSASELGSLTLDQSDVDDLTACRVGACGVKLDAQGISKLARRDAVGGTASAAMREYLADYARRYALSGNRALIEYRSGSGPRRLGDHLRLILDQSPYLRSAWPSLYHAIGEFSGVLGEGLDGFLYWSKEKIGPRAVISLTHVIVSPPHDGFAAVATKQLYASHYSDASLGVTLLINKGTPATPKTLIVYVNRSRVDVFGGVLGGLKRPIVRSRAREGAERTMRRLVERIDREYRETPPKEAHYRY